MILKLAITTVSLFGFSVFYTDSFLRWGIRETANRYDFSTTAIGSWLYQFALLKSVSLKNHYLLAIRRTGMPMDVHSRTGQIIKTL